MSKADGAVCVEIFATVSELSIHAHFNPFTLLRLIRPGTAEVAGPLGYVRAVTPRGNCCRLIKSMISEQTFCQLTHTNMPLGLEGTTK